MAHKNYKEDWVEPETFPSQLSGVCFLSFWPQESATIFLAVGHPQEKRVRGPCLTCALGVFTCVLTMVKATPLWDEKWVWIPSLHPCFQLSSIYLLQNFWRPSLETSHWSSSSNKYRACWGQNNANIHLWVFPWVMFYLCLTSGLFVLQGRYCP